VYLRVEVHQQVRVLVDVVIAALLHLIAYGSLEVARDQGRIAAAVGPGLIRKSERGVLGEIGIGRGVHMDVRPRIARTTCERSERDSAHAERKVEMFHGTNPRQSPGTAIATPVQQPGSARPLRAN